MGSSSGFGNASAFGGQKFGVGTASFDAMEKANADAEAKRQEEAKKAEQAARGPTATQLAYEASLAPKSSGDTSASNAFNDKRAGDNFFTSMSKTSTGSAAFGDSGKSAGSTKMSSFGKQGGGFGGAS